MKCHLIAVGYSSIVAALMITEANAVNNNKLSEKI